MSYRITEAERKHVATIEDVELKLTVVEEEGTTPEVKLEISDGDKLDLSAVFPQYSIAVDKTDDEHSRFRVVDKEGKTVLNAEGLRSLNGNPLGLGWRYGLEFIFDEDEYVKGISLINKNNDTKSEKVITKLADMEIKSVVIPESNSEGLTVKAKALFTKPVKIEANVNEAALIVKNSTGKHAVVGKAHFENNYAIKTEENDKVSFDNIETKNVSLKEGDKSVSITAEKTEFINNDVSLKNAKVDGNNDTELNNLKSVSTNTLNAGTANTGTVNTGDVNTRGMNAQTINVQQNANVNTLNVGTENVNTINVGTVNSSNANVDNLTVTGRTRLEGDNYARAMDIDGRLIAGKIKSLSDIQATDVISENIQTNSLIANSTKTGSLEAVSEKVTSSEIRNLKVTRNLDAIKVSSQSDIEAARDIKAGMSVVTDIIKSKDDKVLLEKANADTAVLGSTNIQTIIKTRSDPNTTNLQEEHGHVKAIVDGREVYLANLDDCMSDKIRGYVDRSTNQDISGVKEFNDVMVASAGVAIRDEEGHLRGIISHVEDYTDIELKKNPVWVDAKTDADAYDELLSHYDHLRADYNVLQDLKRDLEDATTALATAEETLANEQAESTALRNQKTQLRAQLEEAETNLANSESALREKEVILHNKQTNVDSLLAIYNQAQHDVDNDIADETTMAQALAAALYFNDDFDDSFLENNADYNFLRNELNCTNLFYEDAISALDKMIAVLDIVSESTQTNVVAYCETAKAYIINNAKPRVQNDHNNLITVRDNAQYNYDTAYANLMAYTNGEYANAMAAKANLKAIKDGINTSIANTTEQIAINDGEIEAAQLALTEAEDNKIEKEISYSNAKNVYEANYADYAEKLPFEYTEEMMNAGTFNPPEMSEKVASFKNNEIPEIDYQPSDTIHLGNSKDTLKVMSKGLHSGDGIDQHIQATIDGHDHILANTDDILAVNVMKAFDRKYIDNITGEEKIDPGKIVGDVTIAGNTDGEGNTIPGAKLVIGQADVISGYDGQTLPEGQPEPNKLEKNIELTSVDNTVEINVTEDGKIDFSTQKTIEQLNTTINNIYITEEGTVKIKNVDGTEKDLMFISTFNDLSIDSIADNILDFNMNNFYNTELITKEEILNLYDKVGPVDSRKVPNAFDVKVLMDAVGARVDILARNLEERLPVAPNEAGRYFLVANVRNNVNGETTATYTWDGTASLPDVYIPTGNDTPEEELPEECFDGEGNLYVPYEAPEFAEYTLKMRILKTYNSEGQVVYSPRTMWMRIDNGSDFKKELNIPRDHTYDYAVAYKGYQGTKEDYINDLKNAIDTDGDNEVSCNIYIVPKTDWDSASNTMRSGSHNLSDYFIETRKYPIGTDIESIKKDGFTICTPTDEENYWDDSVPSAEYLVPVVKEQDLNNIIGKGGYNLAYLRDGMDIVYLQDKTEEEMAEDRASNFDPESLRNHYYLNLYLDRVEREGLYSSVEEAAYLIKDALDTDNDNKITFTLYHATDEDIRKIYAGKKQIDDLPKTVETCDIGTTLDERFNGIHNSNLYCTHPYRDGSLYANGPHSYLPDKQSERSLSRGYINYPEECYIEDGTEIILVEDTPQDPTKIKVHIYDARSANGSDLKGCYVNTLSLPIGSSLTQVLEKIPHYNRYLTPDSLYYYWNLSDFPNYIYYVGDGFTGTSRDYISGYSLRDIMEHGGDKSNQEDTDKYMLADGMTIVCMN